MFLIFRKIRPPNLYHFKINIITMKSIITILIVVLFYIVGVNCAKNGCPEPIDVRPCTCTNSPFTYLQCRHLDDAEILRGVFTNSTDYKYNEVHIEYSVLPFIPHNMFEDVPVSELHLLNVTLSQIFDHPPENLEGLRKLHLENTKVIRGIVWKLLEPLKNLEILNVYFNHIKVLGYEFKQYTPKNLKQLSFYSTGTKIIKNGVFEKFTSLEKVAFDKCNFIKLSRDMFPRPFNVKVIYLNDNHLKSIPDDMFADMPELATVGLKNNHLSVIPASAFVGSYRKLIYLRLEGNPLICDCRLAWLIKSPPSVLGGTCAEPTARIGKELNDLELDNC